MGKYYLWVKSGETCPESMVSGRLSSVGSTTGRKQYPATPLLSLTAAQADVKGHLDTPSSFWSH
jgi:hypothetical protein